MMFIDNRLQVTSAGISSFRGRQMACKTEEKSGQMVFALKFVRFSCNNSVVISPLENYTDRAVAAGQRS
jgi:hypothetical protein